MKQLFIALLLLTVTVSADEIPKLSIDNGNYKLELPYLELVMPNEAYSVTLTSSDGIYFIVDYSTVRQLPLNPNVDENEQPPTKVGGIV